MAATDFPNQTAQGLHVNQLLTDFSLGYHPMGFIADSVFPVISVKKESDLFLKWSKEDAFRQGRTDGFDTLRADGTIAGEERFGTTMDSYLARERARRVKITDRERDNADPVIDLQRSRVRRAQDKILLDYEQRVAGIVRATANYTASVTNYTTLTTTAQWNNSSFSSLGTTGSGHSVIKANILTGMDTVRKNTGGYLPNRIVIPFPVATVLSNDPGLDDLRKYVENLLAGADGSNLVAPIFMGMKVLIPLAMYTSNVEGVAGGMTDVWGKDVIMFYAPNTPQRDDLAFGFTFRSRPWQVKEYREERESSTYYEAGMIQDEKLVTSDCAYLIKTAVA